jgi:hypothetical protein
MACASKDPMDPKAKISRAWMRSPGGRWAGVVTMALLASSCAQIIGIEDLPPLDSIDASLAGPADGALPPDIPDTGSGDMVFGQATGVLGEVALELRAGAGVTELLTVTHDGPFAFVTRLEPGVSYTVVFSNPDTPCTLWNQTGRAGVSLEAVELRCNGATLTSMAVSGDMPAIIQIMPGTTGYLVEVPSLQQSVELTANVARIEDTLTIAGVAVDSGTPSPPMTLQSGDTLIEIVVASSFGWSRAYPITIRRASQIAQYAYAKASNPGVGDQFGHSVALSDDTLVVGTPYEDSAARGIDGNQDSNTAEDSGAVYVFRRSGASWRQEAYIKASNAEAGDFFGWSVALSGDVLAVGAWGEDSAARGTNGNQADDSAPNSGAVYVFRRRDSIWRQEGYIKASYADAGDQFGVSVALDGDTLAVGAHLEDGSIADSGAVYVFRRSAAEWQREALVQPASGSELDRFGYSVALSGETLAIGAWGEDSAARGINVEQTDDGAQESGAVYVFRRAGTIWRQEAAIKASNTDAGDRFGQRVALWGDTLAVGAWGEDSAARGIDGDQENDACPESGAVYVFHRSGTVWQQEAYIKASNTGADDWFGYSVGLWGGMLAVGAHREDGALGGLDDHSAMRSGALYVFRRNGTSWAQEAYLKASNAGREDIFGYSVASWGDTIAAGALWEDGAATVIDGQPDKGTANSGAVYLFHWTHR